MLGRLGPIALVMMCAAAGCKKTGENEYEIQRPTIGTTTDTVRTPDVDVGKDTHTVVTPDVDVHTPGDTARDTTR